MRMACRERGQKTYLFAAVSLRLLLHSFPRSPSRSACSRYASLLFPTDCLMISCWCLHLLSPRRDLCLGEACYWPAFFCVCSCVPVAVARDTVSSYILLNLFRLFYSSSCMFRKHMLSLLLLLLSKFRGRLSKCLLSTQLLTVVSVSGSCEPVYVCL